MGPLNGGVTPKLITPQEHKQQMRLFDDTMKALALNAYEMNNVYQKMVKESV